MRAYWSRVRDFAGDDFMFPAGRPRFWKFLCQWSSAFFLALRGD